MREPMQSLWVGDRLSKLEQLSIRSYQYHGHDYHLYTYGHVEGVPSGVVIKDAAEIVSPYSIKQFRCIANFSDFFRYCLLFKHGGWWTDTDAVCLRPFEFTEEHVFSSEALQRENGKLHVNCGTIRVPRGCEMLLEALLRIARTNVATAGWSEIWPQLLQQLVGEFKLQQFVKAPKTFCPVPWWDAALMVKTTFGLNNSYAVHLWNEMWRQNNLDKDADYPQQSLFEQLKREYLN